MAARTAAHHPFVYKKMVLGPAGMPRPRDGDLVRVIDRDGLPLGFALWNSRSQIAAFRLLSNAYDPPDAAFWTGRLDEAVRCRRDVLKLDAPRPTPTASSTARGMASPGSSSIDTPTCALGRDLQPRHVPEDRA